VAHDTLSDSGFKNGNKSRVFEVNSWFVTFDFETTFSGVDIWYGTCDWGLYAEEKNNIVLGFMEVYFGYVACNTWFCVVNVYVKCV
jgi:hypothetical protein